MYTLKQRRRWDSLHSELNFFFFFSFGGLIFQDTSSYTCEASMWCLILSSQFQYQRRSPEWPQLRKKRPWSLQDLALKRLTNFNSFMFFFYWGKRKTELSVQLQWRRRTQMLPSSGRSGQRYAPGEFDLSPSLATLLITSWQETAVDDSIEKK